MGNVVEHAKQAARVLNERQGIGVSILDVRALSSITDFFVFAGATSHVHVRALEDQVRDTLRHAGIDIVGIDGARGHGWRVIDYGSIMIHIMEEEIRDFYGVERLWAQGKLVSFKKGKKKVAAKKKKKAKKKAKKRKKQKK